MLRRAPKRRIAHPQKRVVSSLTATRHVATNAPPQHPKRIDTNASPQQEAVRVHLGLYLLGQRLELFAQGADQLGVAGIVALGVHVAVGLRALEVEADVIEGGVGVGVRLGVVVPPEVAARVQHRLRLGREDHGLFGYQIEISREEIARFRLLPAEPAR